MKKDNLKELVKERASLDEVFAHYNIHIGDDDKCLCPFHDEATPSLKVNRKEKGDYFHCFGCGASGDALSAEQQLSGEDDFQVVLVNLAKRLNIPLPDTLQKPTFVDPNAHKKNAVNPKPRTPKAPAKEKPEPRPKDPIQKRDYITHYDYLTPEKTLQLRAVRELFTHKSGKEEKNFQQYRPANDKEIEKNCTINPETGEKITSKIRQKDGKEWARDENGQFVYKIVEKALKTFSYSWAKDVDKWAGSLEGYTLQYLYNADKWFDSKNKTLIKTEGEKDADFIQSLGVNATCNNSGSNKNTADKTIENLIAGGITEVIHFADSDMPGIKYILAEMKNFRRLGIQKQRFVILGNFRDISKSHGRDIFDELSELNPEIQEIHLDKLMHEARTFDARTEKHLDKLNHILQMRYNDKYREKFLAKEQSAPKSKQSDSGDKNPPKQGSHQSQNLKDHYDETDSGNAELLFDLHGDKIRYIGGREMREFSTWKQTAQKGGHWEIVDETALLKYTKDVYKWRATYAEKLPNHTETLQKIKTRSQAFALTSQNENRRNAMIRLLRGDERIITNINDYDADRYILNLKNGVYDLRNHHFRGAKKEDLCLKQAGVNFEPDAQAPIFQRVIKTSMTVTKDGQQKPDTKSVNFLQRWFGYSMTGDVGEEVMCIFYGPKGRNGKTKICESIMHVLGDYGDPAPSDLLVQKDSEGVPTDLADLQGRRFVVISEPEANTKLAVSKMKYLVGGDTIKARKMFKDFYKFSPTHKMTMLTNEKPRVNSTEPNVWDKIYLVPFLYMIPKEQRDKKLAEKLHAESAGILNWLIEGCKAWQESGLEPPERIVQQGEKWKKDEDILAEFIEDELVESKDPAQRVKTKIEKGKLYEIFAEYCRRMNTKAYDKSWLGRLLKRRGWEDGKSGNTRYWVGWREKSEMDKKTELILAQNDGFAVDVNALDETLQNDEPF